MNKSKFQEFVKNNYIIIFISAFFAIVYGIMMFVNKPWYDELYTYYSFISRGPVYAAIHWPVPNNHVGYSVLSACLNIFGNPYISLRGISFLASVSNIILIYRICIRFMEKEYSAGAAAIYAFSNLVYTLAIQGRGYSLATTYYLLSIYCCYHICLEEHKWYDYWFFALSLAAGLYVLPSSLYWVLPICAIGGIYYIFKLKGKDLLKLFLSALAGAAITLFLYMLIWLAIGANLISKDPSSTYYGVYQVNIILKEPFLSAKTGIDYMLATPYIQSISRMDAITGMPEYFKSLFDMFYSYSGIAMIICCASIWVFCIWYAVRYFRQQHYRLWIAIYIGISIISVPCMLIVQSVHPYKRVFSFYMVPIAIGISYCTYRLMAYCLDKKKQQTMALVFVAVVLINGWLHMTSYDYRRPLAGRENSLHGLFEQCDAKAIDSIFYTDDFQKYVLKFYYDVEPEEKSLEEANYIAVYSSMTKDETLWADWPLLYTYDREMLLYIFYHFDPIATYDDYTLYARK